MIGNDLHNMLAQRHIYPKNLQKIVVFVKNSDFEEIYTAEKRFHFVFKH